MLVCVPVGPLGFLSVQRTIKEGRKIGFLSGMGAALSDMIYSMLAIFGISIIDDILKGYNRLINCIAGILFLAAGIYIIMNSSKSDKKVTDPENREGEKGRMLNTVASTFFMGLSNPMTFFIFITVFAKAKINLEAGNVLQNIAFALSIFVGSCILWIFVTSIIKLSKRSMDLNTVVFIDKIIGIVIFFLVLSAY